MDDDMIFLHGQSEETGVEIIRAGYESALSEHHIDGLRNWHLDYEKFRNRPITILGFGVDHGLGAHAGNGSDWRTTVVAHVQYDYLKGKPEGYIRLEGDTATDLLSQLAQAVAISRRSIGD